jgi:hypothetical protein
MPALLPEPAVPVAYDLALSFLDRARAADSHLPAQKLQNLLYLASVHYENANGGRSIAPFAFVANDITVVDPNLYRLLEDGRPKLRAEPLPAAIDAFVGEIWGRYGNATVEHLNAIVRRILDGDGRTSTNEGWIGGNAVPPRAHTPEGFALERDAPAVTSGALRPSHLGRQVAVSPWRPPSVPKKS